MVHSTPYATKQIYLASSLKRIFVHMSTKIRISLHHTIVSLADHFLPNKNKKGSGYARLYHSDIETIPSVTGYKQYTYKGLH